MGRHKSLFIATLVFFLLVNTTYYWEGLLGMFAMIMFLVLVVYFIGLAVLLLVQISAAVREKLHDRKRLILISIMTGVLALAFIFPGGFVDFEKFESDVVLTAQAEGAANCMTILKLRENGTFKMRDVCFGISETVGQYKIKGDTIFFDSNSTNDRREFYEFAVLERKSEDGKYHEDLKCFKTKADTNGMALEIMADHLWE